MPHKVQLQLGYPASRNRSCSRDAVGDGSKLPDKLSTARCKLCPSTLLPCQSPKIEKCPTRVTGDQVSEERPSSVPRVQITYKTIGLGDSSRNDPDVRSTMPAAAATTPTKRERALSPLKRGGCGSISEGSPSKQRAYQLQLPEGGSCLPLTPAKIPVNGIPGSQAKCSRTPVVLLSPTKLHKENIPAVDVATTAPCKGSPARLSHGSISNSTSRRSLAFEPSATSPCTKGDDELLQRAKKALHTAQPSSMCCREKEAAEIGSFLTDNVCSRTAGSMYISGAPGTGKTATLQRVLKEFELPCHKIYVNCMMVKSFGQLYERIGEGLHTGATLTMEKPLSKAGLKTAKQLQKAFTSGGACGKLPAVLVLDEVDQLVSRSQELLYTIFEWPSLENSRLILIGIANALDLTDRLLPRLHARPNCKPKLLHFAPYTKDQIQQIISTRLQELDACSVFDATAIQFCARKIAAVTGDVRKALDVCRRSIEVVEAERKTISSNAIHAACNAKLAPVIRLPDMASLLSNSQQSAASDEGLPLQQKLAACSLLLLLKHGKLKEVLFGKLHDTYTKVCRRRAVSPTDQSEFLNICMLLESRGLMNLKKAKDACRMSKVSLKVDESELEHSLQDKLLVTSVLSEGLP